MTKSQTPGGAAAPPASLSRTPITISDYIDKKLNKKYSAYSTLYNLQQSVYQESRIMRETSNKCKKLREEIMNTWQ